MDNSAPLAAHPDARLLSAAEFAKLKNSLKASELAKQITDRDAADLKALGITISKEN